MPILTLCDHCNKQQYVPFGIFEEYEARRRGQDPNKCQYCGESLVGTRSYVGLVVFAIVLLLIAGVVWAAVLLVSWVPKILN
jgi:hypothetical protein